MPPHHRLHNPSYYSHCCRRDTDCSLCTERCLCPKLVISQENDFIQVVGKQSPTLFFNQLSAVCREKGTRYKKIPWMKGNFLVLQTWKDWATKAWHISWHIMKCLLLNCLTLLNSKYYCPNLPSDSWANRSLQVFWRKHWQVWLRDGLNLLELTWKRVLAPCNLAGLRGATGLRVLQKWILESKGLGVSKMGVCKTHKDSQSCESCAWE